METVTIDIETKSDRDITKSGVYAYADSKYFDILLFSYSVDGGAVQVIDLANGETIPDKILKAFADENIIKQAFNVNFERVCLSVYVQRNYPQYFREYEENYFNPAGWHCTMIHSRYLSLPSSLAEVGRVLKIQEQKMTEGKALIKFFCVPYKNDDETEFHNPLLYPDKWEIFKAYNKRDVEAEMEIDRRLSKYPVPDFIWEEFYIDQKINDRGILIDLQLAQNAVALDEHIKTELSAEMQKLTDIENPNSVYQLLKWLEEQGYSSDSLGKEQVAELLKTAEEPVRTVLALRQQLAKSSVKKYTAMTNMVCSDGRARGTFSFYGASKTGRFSSKNIQIQNLPQNHISDLAGTREIIRSGDFELAEMLYDNIPDILSQLIRTALIPKNGHKFIVSDYSSIEARVLAWLAGETWRMQAFSRGDDIYCASASKMFGVPVVKHGVNGHLRQKGKVAELACIAEGQLVLTNHGLIPIEKVSTDDKLWDGENWVKHDGVVYKGKREVITYEGLTATPDHLVFHRNHYLPLSEIAGKQAEIKGIQKVYDIRNAGRHHRFTISGKLVHNCGYGGSVGAMKAMGGSAMGLSDSELKQIVTDWRTASPNIVKLWYAVDNAAMTAVIQRTTTETHGIKFIYQNGILFVELPSKRRLAYIKPQIDVNRFGGDSLTYEGVGTTKKWERLETFGSKIVENIVQGIARDLLCHSMKTLSECRIVAHVHDELIIETDKNITLDYISKKMAETPYWAEGLILRADGFECQFYQKD